MIPSIPATAESEAIVALDKKTGEQIWRQEAQGFAGTWGTPVISQLEDGTQEIVMGVPYEVWGFNPESGKLKWYAETVDSDSMCSSVVEHEGVVYTIEGRSGGAAAVKVGGKGDVTDKNVIWSGRNRGRISTPIYYKGNLYWISSGVANAISAETGEEVYQARIQSSGSSTDRDESSGRSFGRGRGMGGQSYSSPVVADGNMFYVNRSGEATVIKLGDEFEQLATNKFAEDSSDYHGT
ncbi:PQQ-like beta-propeller repeat protein, partial [Planctomicrobium sp.]